MRAGASSGRPAGPTSTACAAAFSSGCRPTSSGPSARSGNGSPSGLARGHRARLAGPAAYLAHRPGEAADTLVELVGLEHGEGEAERRLRAAFGRDRPAGGEGHSVADRLGVEGALVDRPGEGDPDMVPAL